MSEKAELVKKLIGIQYYDQEAEASAALPKKQAACYNNRALLTYEAIALALRCGYGAGIRIDPQEPDWPVAFIELPTGQISYHLAQHPVAWDAHDTGVKRLRVLKFIAEVTSAP